jgi:hypothetical protein
MFDCFDNYTTDCPEKKLGDVGCRDLSSNWRLQLQCCRRHKIVTVFTLTDHAAGSCYIWQCKYKDHLRYGMEAGTIHVEPTIRGTASRSTSLITTPALTQSSRASDYDGEDCQHPTAIPCNKADCGLSKVCTDYGSYDADWMNSNFRDTRAS